MMIKSGQLIILEIGEHRLELSAQLKAQINEGLDEYGLMLPEFYVMRISLPKGDPNYMRMRQQQADRYLLVREEQIKKAEAKAKEMQMKGYTFTEDTTRSIPRESVYTRAEKAEQRRERTGAFPVTT